MVPILSQTTDLTKAREDAEAINIIEVPARSQLPFDLLHRKSKKTTKLLANSGSTEPMNGSNRWYDFEFTEPVFLNEITVYEENYSTYNEFEFRWTLAQGAEVTQELSKNNDSSYRASINQLVRQVSFKPPKKWLTQTKITRVQLVGFQIEELESFIRLVSKLDKYKENVLSETNRAIENADEANQKVTQAELDREALNSEIAEANQKVADLNANIGRLSEQRQGLLDDITKRSDLDFRRTPQPNPRTNNRANN